MGIRLLVMDSTQYVADAWVHSFVEFQSLHFKLLNFEKQKVRMENS